LSSRDSNNSVKELIDVEITSGNTVNTAHTQDSQQNREVKSMVLRKRFSKIMIRPISPKKLK